MALGPGIPRKPDTSSGFQPRFAPTAELLVPARESLRLDGVLDGAVLGPQLHRFLLDWARLRSVYSSSKMEGNPITLADASRVLHQGIAEKPNEREVLQLSRAYARIHETKSFHPLTIDDVRSYHRDLFRAAPLEEGEPGALKDKTNGVYDDALAGYVFEATPPERTEAELQALLEWYYGPGQLLDPAISAGLFFVEFQAIHPFLDGNGRIGRLVNQRLLRASGFKNVTLTALDGVLLRRSDTYYKALRATNGGENYHVWLRFYVGALRQAYKESVERGDLQPLLDQVGNGCEREILEWALTSGVEWFQRGAYPNPKRYADVTLSQALGSLVEQGILERQGETRAARYRLGEGLLRNVYAKRGTSGA